MDERARLESVCPALRDRGFESHPHRSNKIARIRVAKWVAADALKELRKIGFNLLP